MIYYLQYGENTSIVHVWVGELNIAQAGYFKLQGVYAKTGDFLSANIIKPV